jgi:hypothetical protein
VWLPWPQLRFDFLSFALLQQLKAAGILFPACGMQQ